MQRSLVPIAVSRDGCAWWELPGLPLIFGSEKDAHAFVTFATACGCDILHDRETFLSVLKDEWAARRFGETVPRGVHRVAGPGGVGTRLVQGREDPVVPFDAKSYYAYERNAPR